MSVCGAPGYVFAFYSLKTASKDQIFLVLRIEERFIQIKGFHGNATLYDAGLDEPAGAP